MLLPTLALFAALAQEPGEAKTLDQWIDELPPIACQRHLDEHEKPVEAPALAELRRAVDARALSDEQWRRALVKSGAIRWRKRWPVDRPFAVSMAAPHWLQGNDGMRAQVTLVPRVVGWRDATGGHLDAEFCGTAIDMRVRRERTQALGPLAPDLRVVPCFVHVMRRLRDGTRTAGGKRELVWQGTLELEVEPVATLEESLPGVHDANLDRAVAASFAARIVVGTETDPSMYLHLIPDPVAQPELADLGLSLDVELRKGRRVFALAELDLASDWHFYLHHPRAGCGPWDTQEAARSVEPSPRALRDVPPDFAEWTLVVRGTSKSVIEQWDAERYWDGRLEIPLAEALAPRPDEWWLPVGRRPASVGRR